MPIHMTHHSLQRDSIEQRRLGRMSQFGRVCDAPEDARLVQLAQSRNLGEGDGRAVDFGEEEAVEDDLRMDGLMGVYWGRSRSMDLVEGGIRPAGQKAVELRNI